MDIFMLVVNILFSFIASFLILSICWITPLAGTEAAHKNQSKAFGVILAISVIFTAFMNVG